MLYVCLFNLKGVCGFERRDISIGDEIHITSPNYPYNYPSHFICIWRLSAINAEGSFVIQFLDFDTEPDTDILTVGKGNIISTKLVFLTFSSWVPSNVVAVIGEQNIWMEFKSDFAISGRGFEFQIERIKDTGRRRFDIVTDWFQRKSVINPVPNFSAQNLDKKPENTSI